VPKSTQTQQAIHERRQRVASLRLAGIRSETQIAKLVGVSQPTIHRDLVALDTEWRQQAAEDIAAAKGRDLAALDALQSRLWERAMKGDTGAIREIVAIVKQRASLLGYAAPLRVTGADGRGPVEHRHTHHDFSGYTSEEASALYDLAARYADEAAR
jgi:hypothetical protein